MGIEINDFIQRRMDKFGITRNQVEYVLGHCAPSYGTNNPLVYRASLPDGRVVRIQTDAEGRIRDVYTHSKTYQEGKK